MLYGARGGTVAVNDAKMDYIKFGISGGPVLIMIPGLGDGLRTVQGMAVPFAVAYRKYAKRFQVYVFSRKEPLESEATTRSMAQDLQAALDSLNIERASVIGVSQGGMIAQYLAMDDPQRVERLVLAVTMSRPNETIQGVLKSWMGMAEIGDYYGLITDTAEKSYTQEYIQKKHLRAVYPVMGRIGKPKDFKRFLIQAQACLNHNAYEELKRICCQTLVIGGSEDQIVGPKAAKEISEKLPDSKLVILSGLGHAAYEETDDFNRIVLEWLGGVD